MKPITATALLANRQEELAASRARVDFLAQRQRYREAERKARDVLKDAIVVAGVSPHAGTTILAAAESDAKARVISALADRIDPEPVDGGAQ